MTRISSSASTSRHLRRSLAVIVLTALVPTMIGTAAPASPAPGGSRLESSVSADSAGKHPSCSIATPGAFHCWAAWRPGGSRPGTARGGGPGLPESGYGPADIQSAYLLDTGRGADQTVAVVDAYDNPNAESDLAAYRKVYRLPPCTTANGCFRKVNESGGQVPPEPDAGWGVEIALDIQAVSAACPRCHILLVEASSPEFESIGTAVVTAAKLGAHVISNSYGADEFAGIRQLGAKYYSHPGVAQVVSSGDYGFGPAAFPANLRQVIATGGTSLTKDTNGRWRESAWSDAGSGCSAWVSKPSWQHDAHCPMRTVSDISAVADPDTGLAVYDTFGLGPDNGWIVVGGTSLSAPLIAGIIGLSGLAARLDSAQYLYAHHRGLTDVVVGKNGICGGDYLCNAKGGYDGPTGWGTPRPPVGS
jgi:hypothetical protein